MQTSNRLLLAIRVANEAHNGQYRKWGHSSIPYIIHPLRVMNNVAMILESTEDMVIAAVLHDVLEDTKLTEADLVAKGFGGEVVLFVKALTNPSKGSNLTRADRKAMDRQHLAGASWEVKVIKLANRIDNMLEVRNDPTSPKDFVELYKNESRLLLEVLKGTNEELEAVLAKLVC